MTTNHALIEFLSNFITDNRLSLYQEILKERTRYFTVVMEDIFQGHNASAVLRSCDCFGVQDVHLIETRNEFNVCSRISRGSDNWIFQHHHESCNTVQVLASLKEKGYRIIATTPHKGSVSLYDFDVSAGPFALVFGTEFTGISDEAMSMADEFLTIPMYGFTESLNISVSAAIIINHMATTIRKTEGLNWQLNEEDQDEVMLSWLRQRIRKVDIIEREFYRMQGLQNTDNQIINAK